MGRALIMSKVNEMKKQEMVELVASNFDNVLNTIVSYAISSRYNNIADYRLYSILRVNPADIRDVLNVLYKQDMITVKQVGTFKVITPTSKAYKTTVQNRPVSKADCKKVFMAIMKYEYENTRWLNVANNVLERTVGRSVGVITLDNALAKLIKAGYIEAKVVGSTTLYNSTPLGRKKAMLNN